MDTHPAYARRGLGRLVLAAGEAAARAAGFRLAELTATLAGEPLDRACGYAEVARSEIGSPAGVRVPLGRMAKPLWAPARRPRRMAPNAWPIRSAPRRPDDLFAHAPAASGASERRALARRCPPGLGPSAEAEERHQLGGGGRARPVRTDGRRRRAVADEVHARVRGGLGR